MVEAPVVGASVVILGQRSSGDGVFRPLEPLRKLVASLDVDPEGS